MMAARGRRIIRRSAGVRAPQTVAEDEQQLAMAIALSLSMAEQRGEGGAAERSSSPERTAGGGGTPPPLPRAPDPPPLPRAPDPPPSPTAPTGLSADDVIVDFAQEDGTGGGVLSGEAEGDAGAPLSRQSSGERLARAVSRGVGETLSQFGKMVGKALRVTISAPEASFQCPICFSNFPATEEVALCESGHGFCRECAVGFVGSKVRDRQLCFGCPALLDGSATGCENMVPPDTVRTLCAEDASLLAQLDKFTAMDKNPNIRECPTPGCGHRQVGLGPKKPKMTCEMCSTQYCFVHATAHGPDESCRQYERRMRAQTKATVAFMSRFTQKCPKCKTPTEKSSGCNHMTCQARVDGRTCRQEWCWICGGKLSNVSRHYNPMNPFGCPGAQMNGRGEWINENSYSRTVLNLMMLQTYRIALLFVFGPMLICIALPTLIATVTVCCPCVVIMGRHSRGSKLEVMAAMSLWPMALVAGLLGVALLMALSPLVACVWCVLWDKYYRKAELVKKTLALLGLSPAALVMLGLFLALSPLTLAYGVCKAPNSICGSSSSSAEPADGSPDLRQRDQRVVQM